MKNQKGVTLTILVATIIVMALIVGTISYNSVSSYQLNGYYNMCSDIELLDEKIAFYYLENNSLPIIENKSKTITDFVQDYSEANVNYNPNNSDTLYKIDLTKLDNLSLKNDDYYIDSESHTIYSLKGIEIGEDIYYTAPINYQKVDLALYQ